MKAILLTKGQFAIVDDEDFDRLNQFKWNAQIDRSGHWYAMRGRSPVIRMHREVLQTNREVDHKNNNGLDNRKENLRECTRSQNCANRKKACGAASRFKGVYRQGESWIAKLQKRDSNGRVDRRSLGTFRTEEEAALAYNKAAKEAYGEFALLNEVK